MKIVKFALIVLFLIVAGMIIREVLPIVSVSANPVCNEHQPIPARNINNGDCKCMPATESSKIWVPDETCGIPWTPPEEPPVLAPTPTNILTAFPPPVLPTNVLPTSKPTDVILLPSPTCTSSPVPAPNDPGVQASDPQVDSTPFCDECALRKTEVYLYGEEIKIREGELHVQETNSTWMRR